MEDIGNKKRSNKKYVILLIILIILAFIFTKFINRNDKNNLYLQLHFNTNAGTDRIEMILESIDGEIKSTPKDSGAYIIVLDSDSISDAKQLCVRLNDYWEVSNTRILTEQDIK